MQKQKEMQKQYDKQEKKLRDLKAGGKSTKQAVSPVFINVNSEHKTTEPVVDVVGFFFMFPLRRSKLRTR